MFPIVCVVGGRGASSGRYLLTSYNEVSLWREFLWRGTLAHVRPDSGQGPPHDAACHRRCSVRLMNIQSLSSVDEDCPDLSVVRPVL